VSYIFIEAEKTKQEKKTLKPVVVDSQPTYETVLIPVEKLTYDPMNMREGIGDTPDTEFKEDIEENGITNPLLVRPIGKGKFGVVAGSRRFSKGINAGLKEFPCIVRSMDDITALSRSISENVYQKPIEAYVYQRIFNKLYCMIEKANPKLSKNEVIAVMHKETGKAESTIKGYLVIAEKATPETKEAMKTGKLGDSRTAQDVVRLPKEKQKEAIELIQDKPRSEAQTIIQQVKTETRALTGKTESTEKPKEEKFVFKIELPKDIYALLEKHFWKNEGKKWREKLEYYAKKDKKPFYCNQILLRNSLTEKCEHIIEQYLRK